MHQRSQYIRDNYISLKEGISLVKLYDGELPDQDLDEILEYMNISKRNFLKSWTSLDQKIYGQKRAQ